jgi:dihydroxyacetone kinase-like predicted kinase
LVVSASNVADTVIALLHKADMTIRERITLFYGDNISHSEVMKVSEIIAKEFPHHEIEIHEGGQPHYHFIISLE